MSEVQFVKTFLALLDRKAVKLSSDYVSDPRKYPAQTPYILPKPSNPFPQKSLDGSATKQTTSIDITLTPMKGAGPALTLTKVDIDSSLLDVKTSYAAQATNDVGKIKLLYNKRPASDLKSLRELLPVPTPDRIELMVMILGVGSSASAQANPIDRIGSPAIQVPETNVAQTASGQDATSDAPFSEKAAMQGVTYTGKAGDEISAAEELKTDRFWLDLQAFLTQRLRDDGQGQRLAKLFRGVAGI